MSKEHAEALCLTHSGSQLWLLPYVKAQVKLNTFDLGIQAVQECTAWLHGFLQSSYLTSLQIPNSGLGQHFRSQHSFISGHNSLVPYAPLGSLVGISQESWEMLVCIYNYIYIYICMKRILCYSSGWEPFKLPLKWKWQKIREVL